VADADPSPFEILGRERRHDGFVKLDVYRVRQRLFRGGTTPPLTREVVVAREAVAVICYDPDRDSVVVIDQARLPAEIAGFPPVLTEIVAGLREPGETPADMAAREVREETGLELIGEPWLITHMITTPGHSTETVHVYCGRVDARGAAGWHGLAEEHEDIRVRVLPMTAFAALLSNGGIVNCLALVAGFWLTANRDRVRAAWGTKPA
jgi:ADP-ribose pyrophosphatase